MGDGAQTRPRYDGKPASMPGGRRWFSRRHETSDAHENARLKYQREHGRAARVRKAAERQRRAS